MNIKILAVLAVLFFGISCKSTKEWTQDEVKQIIVANDSRAHIVSVRFVGRTVDSDYPLPRDQPVTVDVVFRCDDGPQQQNPSVNVFPDASVRIGVLVSRSKICD